jgi:release factor glutamine methyltransferase
MTIHEAQSKLMFQLYHLYDDREAANIADLVMESITGWSRVERIVNKAVSLSAPMKELLDNYMRELSAGRPVQYVLHEAWFFNEKFYVDESVLIPRPETEELVAWILAEEKHRHRPSILDVGTGSGCIPIILKRKWSNARVLALDISAPALEVAQRNATALNAEIEFLQIDILDVAKDISLPTVDIMVSNPPYIPVSERQEIHPRVKDHEPAQALFVPDDDALIFYRAIARAASTCLAPLGSVYVETHESRAASVAELFEMSGFKTVEIRRDMQGRERMVRGA